MKDGEGKKRSGGNDDDPMCVYCITGGDRGRRPVGADSRHNSLDAGFDASHKRKRRSHYHLTFTIRPAVKGEPAT